MYTRALGITAPDRSVIVPRTVAPATCAGSRRGIRMTNTSARAAKQWEEIHPGPIRETFIESSIAEPGALSQAHLSFTSVRLLKPRLHVCTNESCSIASLLK